MEITQSQPQNIMSPQGNSLAVFVDGSDGILKVKDINGKLANFSFVFGIYEINSMSKNSIQPNFGNNSALGCYSNIGGGTENSISGDAGCDCCGCCCSDSEGGVGVVDLADITHSSIVGGECNTNCGSHSVISGGHQNLMEGDCAFMGGGFMNSMDVDTEHSAIVTGCCNEMVLSRHSAIISGKENIIGGGSCAFMGSGDGNDIVLSSVSTIVNGTENIVSSSSHGFIGSGTLNSLLRSACSFLGGGCDNTIQEVSCYSFIGSGRANDICCSLYGVIVGGEGNSFFEAQAAFIGSGCLNQVLSTTGVVVGGANNINSGSFAFIGGGFVNVISNNNSGSVISGGGNNNLLVSACFSVISGGCNNTVSQAFSYIGGGVENDVDGLHSVIVGGCENQITAGCFAFIGGGMCNFVSALHSSVLGGFCNSVSFCRSVAMGAYSSVPFDGAKVFATACFSAAGDAESFETLLYGQTNDATPTNLYLVNVLNNKATVSDGRTYYVMATIVGKQDSTNNAMYLRKFAIQNSGGTTALLGAVTAIGIDYESDANWDVAITADDTDDAIQVQVTGGAGQNINWVAKLTGVIMTI